MKKIAIWKVIILTIITIGFYSIFWFARNRNYLVSKEGESIPKWPWLLAVPVAYGTGSIVAFTYLLAAVMSSVDIDATVHAYSMAIIVGCLVAMGIYISWLYLFAEAIEKVTQGRVPRKLSLVLGVCVGPFLIVLYQYYINRIGAHVPNKRYPVSTNLLTATGIIVVVSAFSIISLISGLSGSNAAIKDEIIKTREGFSKIQQLSNDYSKCTAKLATDFPGDLTDENRAAYNAANDACDEIYKEYQETLNRYLRGER